MRLNGAKNEKYIKKYCAQIRSARAYVYTLEADTCWREGCFSLSLMFLMFFLTSGEGFSSEIDAIRCYLVARRRYLII